MSDLKQLAQLIFRETLAAIDIQETMRDKVTRQGSLLSIRTRGNQSPAEKTEDGASALRLNLADYDRICAVAIGKAAAPMARGLSNVLAPEWAIEGIVVAPHDSGRLDRYGGTPGFRTIFAGHPIPDEGSMIAAREILSLLGSCGARTLLFFLLSGGGSALVEMPLDPQVTLGEMQELHRLLVHCGAGIDDMNAVRKHLSAVKGGRLAARAPASAKVTLAVSDVPVGRESSIASGPTLPDPSTVADACAVVERYRLLPLLPAALREKFAHPETIPETPKLGDAAFSRSHFFLLLGMNDLFYHAQRSAEAHGCVTRCDNSTDDWPIPEAIDFLFTKLATLTGENPGRRVCLIADGEVSSPVVGTGVGGRNSALVLASVARLSALKPARNICMLSGGTDGKDGSSPAAGAAADSHTLERARACGLDPDDFARRSDSYNFFRQLGDAIETGATGNNLRDLRLLIGE